MLLPRLPERTLNHRTDTMAVRKVGMQLGADLLIRSMDDRDYGVDVLIEHFTNSEVARLLFFQVKGTTEKIKLLAKNKTVVSCSGFPKHTALYAEQFTLPFIVAYTSIEKNGDGESPVYYLWLQRYIENYLDVRDSKWRTSSSNTLTLHIPVKNTLDGKNLRLKDIAKSSVIDFQALKVIKLYGRLQVLLNRPEILTKHDLDEISDVITRTRKCMLVINACQPLEQSSDEFEKYRIKPLQDHIETMAKKPNKFDADILIEAVGNLYRALEGVAAANLSTGILKQTW
jgi:Domain of unknown function (DUF4365)